MEVEKPPDISDAPTYVDALEEANNLSLSYKADSYIGCFRRCGCTPLTCMTGYLVISFLVIPLSAYLSLSGGILGLFFYGHQYARSFPFFDVVFLAVFLIPVFLVFLHFLTPKITLEDGVLRIREIFRLTKRIDLKDILWVAIHYRGYYIYGRRGLRISLPVRRSAVHRQLIRMLSNLGLMKVKEQASSLVDSTSEISIPLSEKATYRRLIVLFVGVFVLISIAGALIWLALVGVQVKRYVFFADYMVIIFMCIIPALLLLTMLFLGWKKFFDAYGMRNEVFSINGFRSRKMQTVPYDFLKIKLYRGSGNIENLEPGLMEITAPYMKPLYIGPERENFFILPFLLREWAGKSFEIVSMSLAPPWIEPSQYWGTRGMFTRWIFKFKRFMTKKRYLFKRKKKQ